MQSNIVRYYKQLLQELWQNINQMLHPQKTPYTSPKRVSYGVSFVNICEKIDRVLTAPTVPGKTLRPITMKQSITVTS